MKTSLKSLLAGFSLMLAAQVPAQTFTTLHNFASGSGHDGSNPRGGLVLSGNTLYGTTEDGTAAVNSGGYGTLFDVNTDGTGYRTLYNFTDGSDGSEPLGGLTLSSNIMYGTAWEGGDSADGTVFAVNTDGTGFTTLYSFTGGSDGSKPFARLVLSGNTLYGTASEGGDSGHGTVFAVNTDGTGFMALYSFTETIGSLPYLTNSDGANPKAGLVLSGNTLYGTAWEGGNSGHGTVFAVTTDGTGFTNLHSFTETSTNYDGIRTNSDGANPVAGLVLSGDILYGTASGAGASGHGTVFAVNIDGTGFMTLYNFSNGGDGSAPDAGLLLSGNTLYGMASGGGSSSNGTMFALNTDGSGFTTLYSFAYGSDGAAPDAGLLLSGNTLYGMAPVGGSSGYGTIFSLSLPPVTAPQLTISLSGTNVVLTWPDSATGFTLESTSSLVSPVLWTPVSPAPVVVNGQNTVTNPISGAQQFYELSQ